MITQVQAARLVYAHDKAVKARVAEVEASDKAWRRKRLAWVAAEKNFLTLIESIVEDENGVG